MRQLVWGVVVFAAMSVTAAAQETGGTAAPAAQAATPAPALPIEAAKRYTVTLGADLPTAYLFRGIHQESTGFIVQPPIDLGVALGRGVTLNVGQWHSMHSGPTGNYYEADYYGSMTFTAGKWKPGVLLTSYTSPNDRFSTVHELAGVMAYDDSASPFPLSPKATIAFELHGQADGGARRGTYLELGVRPAVALIDGRTPLNLVIPARMGISLKDYYEGALGGDTIGFASTGLMLSVPLKAGGTTWDIHGGIDATWLGKNLALLNAGDGFKPIGVFGVTLTY